MEKKNIKKIFNINKSGDLYALNKPVKSWVEISDGWVFWKDMESNYLGCNDCIAEQIGLENRKAIVGKNDYELFSERLAKLYTALDKNVLNSATIKQFFDYSLCDSESVVSFLTTKIPLVDSRDRIQGILGYSIALKEYKIADLGQAEFQELIKNLHNQTNISQQIPTKIIINNTTLTEKQTACAYYLSKGFAIKQIASKLSISPRTVEGTLHKIKAKLNCGCNSELVELIFDRGVF